MFILGSSIILSLCFLLFLDLFSQAFTFLLPPYRSSYSFSHMEYYILYTLMRYNHSQQWTHHEPHQPIVEVPVAHEEGILDLQQLGHILNILTPHSGGPACRMEEGGRRMVEDEGVINCGDGNQRRAAFGAQEFIIYR